MTFAIVRKGRIVDFTRADSLAALANWVRDRSKAELVMLDLRPGETARAGARVGVTDLRVRLARLEPRAA